MFTYMWICLNCTELQGFPFLPAISKAIPDQVAGYSKNLYEIFYI